MKRCAKLLSSTSVITPQETPRAWHLAFCPTDNTLLATCGADRRARVWRVAAVDAPPRLLCTLGELDEEHTRTIRSCEFSPSGEMLATASFDGKTIVWVREDEDGAKWSVVSTLEGHENEVKSVAWSADSALLATCGRDKTVWIWEGNSPFECVALLSGHSADVKFLKFHPTRNVLASASYDDTVKLWARHEGVDDWCCIQTLSGHENTVWGLTWIGPDTLASCSQDSTIRLWERRFDAAELMDVEESEEGNPPAADPTGSGGGYFVSSAVIETDHERGVLSLDWRNGVLVTAGADDTVHFSLLEADASTFRGATRLADAASTLLGAHNEDINCVRFARNTADDEFVFATVSDDGFLKLWRLE